MNLLIQLKQTTSVFVVAFGLACFGLSPAVQAVSPAPDGGYPNFTTAEGTKALQNLTTGAGNTGVGWYSLFTNSTGGFNTALGAGTLALNNGDQNTATGAGALLLNTTGFANTADGTLALLNNTTGSQNTAIGPQALFSNTIGTFNTAIGVGALLSNTASNNNVAVGSEALALTVGNGVNGGNTAIGHQALSGNTGGIYNVAIGFQALSNASSSYNIAVGWEAGANLTSGDDDIYIGSPGVDGDVQTIRIGDPGKVGKSTYIAGISGHLVGAGIPVLIDNDGLLGTNTSSARFKDKIKPMDDVSEAILALRPVTFRYKREFDPKGIAQFGLVAEDVEKINPDLVARDAKGEVYTVRYDAVNAMLLNEFLKEHAKVEKLKKDFESKIALQQKQIEALSAGLEKVSAQLELNKPAPQTVVNR
jgi:hypothetical protein